MLVRIFEGASWSAATILGDFQFVLLPVSGDKIVVAADAGWAIGQVIDRVHRIGDARDDADVALLVGAMTTSDDQSDLPLAGLDRLGRPAPGPTASVPPVSRPSPWR